MDKERFIDEIFLRFPPEDGVEPNQKRKEYIVAISSEDEKYDYEATLKDIISNYEYKCTPAPFNLRQYLKRHVLVRSQQKYINFPSIWADKYGQSYEFGIEKNEEQTIKDLKLMGFTNIRLTREQNTLQKEGA